MSRDRPAVAAAAAAERRPARPKAAGGGGRRGAKAARPKAAAKAARPKAAAKAARPKAAAKAARPKAAAKAARPKAAAKAARPKAAAKAARPKAAAKAARPKAAAKAARPKAAAKAARPKAAERGGRRRAKARRPAQRSLAASTAGAADAFRREIRQYYDANGFLSWSAAKKKYVILGTNEPKNGLAPCPECGLGQLMVVRSKKTGKRFMGCSNYYSGCEASAPLLQRARLRALKSACAECRWPMVIFRYTRNQSWTRQCSNHRCPTRVSPQTPRTGRSSGS